MKDRRINKIKIFLLILIAFTVILTSACSAKKNTTASVSTPAISNSNSETAYPYYYESGVNVQAEQDLLTAYPIEGKKITPIPGGIPTAMPIEPPEPALGMASISGLLYSYKSGQPIVTTEFFLMPAPGQENTDAPPVIREPDPSLGDIIGQSDQGGNISLNSIPPGNYYLLVETRSGWSLARTSEVDPTPIVVKLVAGNRIPLGLVFISEP